MFDEVKVLAHSSIRVGGRKVLYFDPFEVKEELRDADVIFVTHDHFDHYSPQDIQKVAKESTLLVLPECMKGMEAQSGIPNCRFVRPDGSWEEDGILIQTIPSYNCGKPFHPKEKNYVGYVVTMDGVTYYVAGDSDITPENRQVKCDVALVPVGGKFTMDYKEAAELVNEIVPKLAIPTHYGAVAGGANDGESFAKLVDKKTEVRVML